MSARPVIALAGLTAALIALVLVLSGGDSRYRAEIVLRDAGGLREGANVRFDGAPVGKVSALKLNGDDRAVATIRLDPSVAPIGAGAKALIQADGFFGERYVELERGDVSRPRPTGATIPMERSSVSTRLDDLVDTLDTDTRTALKTFFDEQGTLIVGRGRDLAEVLAALPSGLSDTGRLLDQLSTDNVALGRLVEESDRVLGSVTPERKELGRMVTAAAGTFQALDARRPQLGASVREAPSTLQATRRVLAAVQDAAIPLKPAADGLKDTAPALTETLAKVPSFATAAIPAFGVATRVGPQLERLSRATPTVRRLVPLARTLAKYTREGLDPFTALLEKAAPDVFGVMEGWARSTQGFDGSSRIFRFGATTGTDTFAALLAGLPTPKGRTRAPAKRDPKPAGIPQTVKDTVDQVTHKPLIDIVTDVVKKQPQQVLDDVKDSAGQAVDDLVGGGKPNLLDHLLGP